MSAEKILIVEDDKTTAAVMQLYLSNMGYDVVNIAPSGRDAVEMAKHYRPHLVLMDINLGKGLSGLDAAEIISRNYHIPIIFVTCYSDDRTLEKAKFIAPVGFINKPLREADLKTTIEFALSRAKPDSQPNGKNKGPAAINVLMSLYGLTRTEAKVAEKLAEYPDINFVAEALDIEVSTARTHLKRIYRKTETNRQSVLLHKIVTGAAGLLIGQNDNQTD